MKRRAATVAGGNPPLVSGCSLYEWMKVRRRSYGYMLATSALVLIVLWAGRITWQEMRQLHRGYASVRADAFHL